MTAIKAGGFYWIHDGDETVLVESIDANGVAELRGTSLHNWNEETSMHVSAIGPAVGAELAALKIELLRRTNKR